jgi:hypothetical protein
MAEVYKAYHPGLDRYVAVKVLHSFLAKEEDFLVRFQREARIVATFRHPNIVQVHDCDYDSEHNVYYMVMELIDGPNLKTRLQELSPEGEMLPLEEAIHIVVSVAGALEYAHQHGMVHRDIKPANIIFGQDGQVILSDFGIARMINTTTLTASGAMVGTPAYMAPEQGIGQTGDERSDIYSLGAVLYQLVAGCLPFDADTPLGVILKHINAPLTPPTALNPSLPQGIEAAIVRALAKDPDNRYQTAREFAADLERGLAGEPVEPISPELAMASAMPETTTPPPAKYQTKPWEWPTLSGTLATPSLQAPSAARSKWRWVAMLALVLALIQLILAVLLFATGVPSRIAAVLSQAETPTVGAIGTPTITTTPDLTATYDVNATQFAAWMATYEATTGVTPTPSPTPTPTSSSTPTPDLTATAIAACVFDMDVVIDRAVWPSVLSPGRQFVKRWTIKNTGTCTWPEDVQLVFVSGDELEVIREPEVEPLSPQRAAEVKITLLAPAAYKRYASVWQLQDGKGNPIGEELQITCRVGSTPTPRPTVTATATVTPTATALYTATPAEPVRIDSVGVVPESFHSLQSGEWEVDLYVVARGGNGQYRFYRDVISPGTEFFPSDADEPWVGVYGGARWTVCKNMWISFWVESVGDVAHWDGIIAYPNMEDCP